IVELMLTLSPNNNEEKPRFPGTYSRRDSSLLDISENDEWDEELVGTGATQIPETADFLVWTIDDPPQNSVINQEFRDDCPEDVCSLRVESDCTREFDVVGVKIDGADLAAFEVLSEFDQPEGAE
ncbi:MAG: hypothetical protein AAF602_14360, partial [Myxococcota bacterium]